MKNWKMKIFSSALVASSLLMSTPVLAETIDPSADSDLTLYMIHQGTPLNSGSLECIQVAVIDHSEPASPVFVYTPAFEDEKMPLENIDSVLVAQELARYAEENRIEGEVSFVEDGKVFFDDLDQGLYLIRQKDETEGILPIAPFLISVPQYDEEKDIYTYSVQANPKAEFFVKPDEPKEPEEPDNPKPPKEENPKEKPKDNPPKEEKPSTTKPKKPGTGVQEEGQMFVGLSLAAMGALTLIIKKKISSEEKD